LAVAEAGGPSNARGGGEARAPDSWGWTNTATDPWSRRAPRPGSRGNPEMVAPALFGGKPRKVRNLLRGR